jgi:hypothetical protein
MKETSRLRVGDWVQVRSKEEILATLDRDGTLDGMPFMPEMFAYCGQRFQVYRRAHKACDTVFPIRSRRISYAVHLQTRCSGMAHGGCQAACLIFWKDAWLKRPDGADDAVAGKAPAPRGNPSSSRGAAEEDVHRATIVAGERNDSETVYACQATRLPYASHDLSSWDFRQYIEDYTSRNITAAQLIRGIIYTVYENLINAGVGWGPALRWLYDRFQRLWGGLPYPHRPGKIPSGHPTPAAHLNLQPGDLVRVRPYDEILATCREDARNRGMGFDGEMMPYCGGTYRVRSRVSRIVDEKTGKMLTMSNPCIVLEDVVCQGRYSNCRMFCPRAIYPYWREIWLERVTLAAGPCAQ